MKPYRTELTISDETVKKMETYCDESNFMELGMHNCPDGATWINAETNEKLEVEDEVKKLIELGIKILDKNLLWEIFSQEVADTLAPHVRYVNIVRRKPNHFFPCHKDQEARGCSLYKALIPREKEKYSPFTYFENGKPSTKIGHDTNLWLIDQQDWHEVPKDPYDRYNFQITFNTDFNDVLKILKEMENK